MPQFTPKASNWSGHQTKLMKMMAYIGENSHNFVLILTKDEQRAVCTICTFPLEWERNELKFKNGIHVSLLYFTGVKSSSRARLTGVAM